MDKKIIIAIVVLFGIITCLVISGVIGVIALVVYQSSSSSSSTDSTTPVDTTPVVEATPVDTTPTPDTTPVNTTPTPMILDTIHDSTPIDTTPAGIKAVSNISIGTSVKCSANDPKKAKNAIYRYMGNNTLSHYPSPEIAVTYSPTWNKYTTIDCQGLTLGSPLVAQVSADTTPTGIKAVSNMAVGTSVKCSSNDPKKSGSAVYRYMGNNTISWYPSVAVADTYGKDWNKSTSIDCKGLTLGKTLTANTTPVIPATTIVTSVNGTMHTPLKSNFCLDVYGSTTKDNANVVITTCSGNDSQKISYDPTTQTLKPTHSGKCISVKGNSKTADTQLIQSTCDSSVGQIWQKIVNSDKTVTFQNPNSGKCMDIKDGGTKKNTKVIINNCKKEDAKTSANQKWTWI